MIMPSPLNIQFHFRVNSDTLISDPNQEQTIFKYTHN